MFGEVILGDGIEPRIDLIRGCKRFLLAWITFHVQVYLILFFSVAISRN